jgi:hypothetical protein
MSQHLRLTLILAFTLVGCAATPPVTGPLPTNGTLPTAAPLPAAKVTVYPLPGSLDKTDVFNSDRPETITQDGILLSTLPGDAAVNLDWTFRGHFGVFSHHVAHMSSGNSRPLHIALLAFNQGPTAITLERSSGVTFLTRPDAPFITLPTLTVDPGGTTFAGPGDRVTTALLHEMPAQAAENWTLVAGASRLISDAAVPVAVNGAPGANAKSTIAEYNSNGPVALAEVARFATDDAGPTEADFQTILAKGVLAGPADTEATLMDPTRPPPAGGFRYGRVAGISVGETWAGTLFGEPSSPALPALGNAVGFPIASLYLNNLGTGQIQSAALAKRLPGSAYQSHGNYGVTYDLTIPLENTDAFAQTYTLGFSSPLKISDGDTSGIHYVTGLSQVMFRGTLRLTWSDPVAGHQQRFYHHVLHNGEQPPPFEALRVEAHSKVVALLRLIYPADCTPPQLLTVARLQ